MTTDPFELIARLLGVDPDELRRMATDDIDESDQERLSRFFGVDLTMLSDLQDLSGLDDAKWNATFDADASWIDDPTQSPRQPRHGIGIRPTRRRSPTDRSPNSRHDRERWSCPSCQREFLSHRALQRHYETNPNHPQATLDVRDVDSEQEHSEWIDTEWVEFDDRIETFFTLPGDIEGDELSVTYYPSDEYVEVSGAHEKTIDTNNITDAIEGDVAWRVSGRYLIISFPT